MRRSLLTGLSRASALVLLISATASAQDQRPHALVIGGPGALGYIVPVARNWDLRADIRIGVSQYSSSGDLALLSRSSASWSLTLGLTGLRYFAAESATRTYLAYRIGATRISAYPQMPYDASVGVGAHANVSDRIGLFAELGATYSYFRARRSLTLLDSTVYTTTTTIQGLQAFGQIGVTLRRRNRDAQRP